MSRIEQAMRELSDLRDFYLKLRYRHFESSPVNSKVELAEEPTAYGRPRKSKENK